MVSEAREDAYYARHKSTLEQGVGLAIDAAVVEGAVESDARGNGPDPMLFVAKQILAQHGIDTEGVEEKIAAQRRPDMPSRTEIDLRGNGFDSDGLYALVQALKTMPNVTKLNLRGNTCRNEGVVALSDFLKTNKKITYLNLNENNLGSPGAKAIAEALKVNTALTEVDLSLNYIDDAGGKAIAEALDANKTLKVLNMSGNEIEDKDLRKKCRSRK